MQQAAVAALSAGEGITETAALNVLRTQESSVKVLATVTERLDSQLVGSYLDAEGKPVVHVLTEAAAAEATARARPRSGSVTPSASITWQAASARLSTTVKPSGKAAVAVPRVSTPTTAAGLHRRRRPLHRRRFGVRRRPFGARQLSRQRLRPDPQHHRQAAPRAVTLWNGSTQRISSAANAYVGQRICKSGSTTGLTCGSVERTNVTVNFQQGAVHQLVQASAGVNSGDSGGCIFAGSTGLGITSGMGGGSLYFQPVVEALNAYGVRLN